MLSDKPSDPFEEFFDLVRRLQRGGVQRSEADITRYFLALLTAIGLHPVQDTGQATSRRKRPDILAYTDPANADMAYAAEVVGEAKRPDEILGLGGSLEAALTGALWVDKVVPYIRANTARIQFFVFTSFVDTVLVRVSPALRQRMARQTPEALALDEEAKKMVREGAVFLPLRHLGTARENNAEQTAFSTRLRQLLGAEALRPFRARERANTTPVDTREAMEALALTLARIVAGTGSAWRGLYEQVERALPSSYGGLDDAMRHDLVLYMMAVDPQLDPVGATRLAETHFGAWRESFAAASLQSLVGRLFLVKVVEDAYCVGQTPPLIEPDLWVLHSTEYDGKDAEGVADVFRLRMGRLRTTTNAALHGIAVFGGFFQWVEKALDPADVARLIDLFIVHDFSELPGDLLGRFYEIYAQQLHRTRRRQLGQYFTPLPIVEYMWSLVRDELRHAGIPLDTVEVLDPATGSATFLAEAARRFGAEDVPEFWKRLVGFDIAAHGLGIAQTNLYMAVLSQLTPKQAADVGELRLFVTDALDTRNVTHLENALLFLDKDERAYVERHVQLGRQIKTAQGFRVVIGNPPYLGHSRWALSQMASRFPALLTSSRQAARAQAAQIREDYAWFFAAADFYLRQHGLLCFITSDTYTRLPIYRHFRRELLKQYRIVRLVQLGPGLFEDVSPRVHFAVILLAKRDAPLADAAAAEPYPVFDLTALPTEDGEVVAADDPEPRLRLLAAHARNEEERKAPVMSVLVHPTADRAFVFLPLEGEAAEIRRRFHRDTVPLAERGAADTVVAKKWSGISTKFDHLFHDRDRTALMERMRAFFALCEETRTLSDAASEDRVAAFEPTRFKKPELRARLLEVARLVRTKHLTFHEAAVKRCVSGSLGEDARWYPPRSNTSYLYYEPRIEIPRPPQPNDKATGWGDQSQWRDADSHRMLPKLVFTTSTNPTGRAEYGYRAFVVEDEWYVRMAGAASQQFHYAGLSTVRALGKNNILGQNDLLNPAGVAMRDALQEVGGDAVDLLFYVAAIYNSDAAAQFHRRVSGEGLRLKRIVSTNAKECLEIAQFGKRLRDLHRLRHVAPQFSAGQSFPASMLEPVAPTELLIELGAHAVMGEGNPRLRPEQQIALPEDFWAHVDSRILSTQADVDARVEWLYEA